MRTRTHRSAFHCLVLIVLLGTPALAQWERVAPGIEYRHYQEGKMDIHVARIDLKRDDLHIVSTRESDAGTRVSEFAKRNKALVAINADYFDENMVPIGLAVGPCGQWESTRDTAREGVVAFGERRGEIYEPVHRMAEPEPWITAAVSGWPMIVKDCDALTSRELPGSDKFTRSPHPRTAVGLSRDGARLFLVVADGRREDVPGLTLAELGAWMRRRLRVCRAINLDGGGSSAMWIKDRIVNKPSDKNERRVADHLAVVHQDDLVGCTDREREDKLAAAPPATGQRPPQSPRTASSPRTNAERRSPEEASPATPNKQATPPR